MVTALAALEEGVVGYQRRLGMKGLEIGDYQYANWYLPNTQEAILIKLRALFAVMIFLYKPQILGPGNADYARLLGLGQPTDRIVWPGLALIRLGRKSSLVKGGFWVILTISGLVRDY